MSKKSKRERKGKGTEVATIEPKRAGLQRSPEDIREAVKRATQRSLNRISLLKGKPTDVALQQARGMGYRAIIEREHEKDARLRPGRTTFETLRRAIDLDPDASKAVMNYVLLISQGYKAEAVKPRARAHLKPTVDTAGTAYIREFDARVGSEYGGGMDNLIPVFVLSLLVHGAIAIELELSDDLREVVDVHPVDPTLVSFKREKDTNRLMRGMYVGSHTDLPTDGEGFYELPERQFRYIPFHSDVANPYGRGPLLAALTAILFKIELLDDLRAVVHNQGYGRLDVSVVQERVLESLPDELRVEGREADLEAYVDSHLTKTAASYQALNPDDTFVHWDTTEVNYASPGGTMDFAAVSTIIDNQIVAGLKQLPILLGRNEGATTTHATVQWRIFAEQIGAMQRPLKRAIEWVHTTALNISGSQASGSVEFDGQPVGDELVEAQTLNTNVDALTKARTEGWIDNNEAANRLFDHDAVAEPAPPPAPEVPPTLPDDAPAPEPEPPTDPTRGARREPMPAPVAPEVAPMPDNPAPEPTLAPEPEVDAVAALGTAMRTAFGEHWTDEQVQRRWGHLTGRITPEALVARQTRAATADESQGKLEPNLNADVSAHFATLADVYPIESVSERVRSIDASEIEGVVGEWFEGTELGEGWVSAFVDMLNEHYRNVYNVAGNNAVAELELSGKFELRNEEVERLLREFAGSRVVGINATTIAQMADELARGVELGEGIDDLARRLRAVVAEMSRYRSETIARTETAEMYSRASTEAYKRNGVLDKEWLTVGDALVDAPCPEYERDGAIPVDDEFGGRHAHPPAHPRCRCAIVANLDRFDPPASPWLGE